MDAKPHDTAVDDTPSSSQCSREESTLANVDSTYLRGCRVLVVIPGSVNYFYDVTGRRLAAALTELGANVQVTTLGVFLQENVASTHYDYCFWVNVSEIFYSVGNPSNAQRGLELLRRRSAVVIAFGLDCASTHWFAQLYDLSRRHGADIVADLGFLDQSDLLLSTQRRHYRFVRAGLTAAERAADGAKYTGERSLPWAFVGHHTERRAELAARMARDLDPAGVVYLPPLEPYTATGPHLNEEQFHQVLCQSRLQIWCSHHDSFYMESERFRTSYLAGCLPLKVMTLPTPPPDVPFTNLLCSEQDIVTRARTLDWERERQQFFEEYRRLPSLALELHRLLHPLKPEVVPRSSSSKLSTLRRSLFPEGSARHHWLQKALHRRN